jgi:hypothetical protein
MIPRIPEMDLIRVIIEFSPKIGKFAAEFYSRHIDGITLRTQRN